MFVWTVDRFRLHHTFNTQQATDIAFLVQGPHLLVTESAGLTILTQDQDQEFAANLSLPLQSPVRVDTLSEAGGTLFLVTNSRGPAQMFFAGEMVTPIEVMVRKLM